MGMWLNLGCGLRFDSNWVNLDISSNDYHVKAVDLRNGIPYPDQSFTIVYHSHLLEHLQKVEAKFLIDECYRVLKPSGIIRVVVPDLEQIVRMYLTCLDNVMNNQHEWEENYTWILLELFDQTVRNYSGGEMGKYLRQSKISNLDFIISRIGGEARNILRQQNQTINPLIPKKTKIISGLKHKLINITEILQKTIVGRNNYRALKIGQFRLSGEIHQWMYDQYSLGLILANAGFENPTKVDAVTSAIENWQSNHLDTEPDGSVFKPDSLFMEARKPIK